MYILSIIVIRNFFPDSRSCSLNIGLMNNKLTLIEQTHF